MSTEMKAALGDVSHEGVAGGGYGAQGFRAVDGRGEKALGSFAWGT